MSILKNNHGGKRKGAGRKVSAPTVVYQFRIEKEVIDRVKTNLSTKEINRRLRDLIASLE